MPALVSDLARLTRPNSVAIATNTAVQTRFGTNARDNSDSPIVTFYDLNADAQTMVASRLTLLTNPTAGDRKLLTLTVDGIKPLTGFLAFNTTTPWVYVTDPTLGTANYMVTGVSYDFSNMQTVLTLFG